MTTRRAAEASSEAPRSFYEVLEVPREATVAELRRAFRRLARRHHPDRNPGDPGAAARFQAILRAYEILADPERRALYDEFGEVGLARGFDAAAARARQARRHESGARRGEDAAAAEGEATSRARGVLGQLFGGIFGRGAEPERGKDVEVVIRLEFLEALRGSQRTLSIRQPGPCPSCVGAAADTGAGPCKACDGSGTVERAVRLRARIPPGVVTGSRVRLEGQGGRGRGGGPPGDLWMVMQVADHPIFGRSGDDVTIDVPITVAEAVRGGSVAIPTPEGEVSLRIPPGSQSGRRLRLRGKGAPRLDGGTRGDLLARVLIQVPEAGAELAAIAESLEPLYSESFRRRFGG